MEKVNILLLNTLLLQLCNYCFYYNSIQISKHEIIRTDDKLEELDYKSVKNKLRT